MKTPHLILLTIASFAALAAFADDNSPVEIPLRFVAASDAFAAIKEQFGPPTGHPSATVDTKRNSITLDSRHPHAAKIREFLTTFDHRTLQVRVDATITRRVEATATSPAREEVLSRPTIFSQPDRPVVFAISENQGPTKIELRITSLPK